MYSDVCKKMESNDFGANAAWLCCNQATDIRQESITIRRVLESNKFKCLIVTKSWQLKLINEILHAIHFMV